MTTQWAKSVLQGSFRGAKFFTSNAYAGGGRRVNTKNFPEKDDPEFQDMGRAVRTFSITAYVMGDTAFKDRDALIKAIETRGPGTLVHPYRGSMQAIGKSYSISESEAEARYIQISMEFEAVNAAVTKAVKDTKAEVFRRKMSLLEKIGAWFEKAYNATRKPVNALEKAQGTIDSCLSVVSMAKKVTSVSDEFTRSLRQISGRTDVLLLNSKIMAQDFTTLINFGTDETNFVPAFLLPDVARQQRREMAGLNAQNAVPLSSNPGELDNAIQRMNQLNALAAQTGLLALIDFNSPEEAIATEQQLIADFDAVLANITPTDDLYSAIRGTLAAVHADLAARAIDLPRLADLVITDQRNALELNQEVYGSLDQFDEVIALNGIIHPGFISTAAPLRLKVSQT